jgi:hypothetical protein
MSVETSDGQLISTSFPSVHGRGTRLVPLEGQVLFEITGPESFGKCPICGDEDAGSREHVPPHSIGGRVLTYTCNRCNNDFGRLEAQMGNWYRGSLDLRVRMDGVPGHRRVGEVLVRPASDGSVWLMPVGQVNGEAQALLESGQGRVSAQEPDSAQIHVSVVKSAYLAACVFLSGIPDTPRARSLRKDLVAARDSSPRNLPPLGAVANDIRVFRGIEEPKSGQLTLVRIPVLAPNEWWISWSESVFIEWPLEIELLEPWIADL